MRPFVSLREVHLVEEWLDRLEAQRRLFAERFPFALPAPDDWSLDGCQPQHGGELTLSTIFLTALANRLLDRPFAPQPLGAQDLAELHGLVSRAGRLEPALREKTLTWLEEEVPGGRFFGEYCLGLWEEGFCAVAAEALDPRFVGGLIVRLSAG